VFGILYSLNESNLFSELAVKLSCLLWGRDIYYSYHSSVSFNKFRGGCLENEDICRIPSKLFENISRKLDALQTQTW